MKIRTDFVTNSSSSSFVTYRLTNSEFCKYLHEQMQKNGFTYEEHSADRPASWVNFSNDSLEADISCPRERLNSNKYLPECWNGRGKYTQNEKDEDIKEMSKLFLDVIGEFIDLSKVDDLEKLYDAFLADLKNDHFKCNVYTGNTD